MRDFLKSTVALVAVLTLVLTDSVARAETVSIVIASNAAPRVVFGAEKLVEALKAVKLDAAIVHTEKVSGRKIFLDRPNDGRREKEGFLIARARANDIAILGNDDSGKLYGCLELAERIRKEGKLSYDFN